MPKLATPLTDIQPRTAKPKAKPYKLTDGGGLWKTYLLADQSETMTARMFTAIYDEPMTMQKVQKQIEAVNLAWRAFGPGIHFIE